MKKSCLVLISSIFLSGYIQIAWANDNPAEKNNTGDNGWTYYSDALYYTNLGINSKEPAEKKACFDKAIDLFEKAIKSGDDSGRIYYHLSEIYYHKGDSKKSMQYAQMAIERDKEYYPPYERLYIIHMDNREYEEAAAIFENYLTVVPDDMNVLYSLGIHYYKYLNDGSRALAKFDKIISLSKTTEMPLEYVENSYYVSGYIYYTRNDFRKSYACYKKAYEINQNNMVAVSMLAMSSFGVYDLKNAEKYALIYLENTPGDLNMMYLLGQVYYINSNPDAIRYLAQVMKSKSFEGFYASGLYYELSGDTNRAENILKSIIKIRDDLLPAYIALSNLSLKKGDMEAAYKGYMSTGSFAFQKGLLEVSEKLFFRALEIKNDNDSDIYFYLARVHEEKKNYALAVSYYNRYYAASKENNILVQIGYIYGIQKKYSKAAEYFARAKELEPDNPVPYFFNGLVQLWDEKYSDAGSNFSKAIEKKGDEETYYYYYAISCEKMNKIDQSIENLRLAIKYNPSSSRSMNYLAYLYADRNMNLDEAYTLIIRALDFEPENGAYLDTLGWIYYRQGKYEKALEYVISAEKKLADENYTDPVVYDHLGDIYIMLGQKDNAMQNWEKAFGINKDKAIEEKIRKNKSEK